MVTIDVNRNRSWLVLLRRAYLATVFAAGNTVLIGAPLKLVLSWL